MNRCLERLVECYKRFSPVYIAQGAEVEWPDRDPDAASLYARDSWVIPSATSGCYLNPAISGRYLKGVRGCIMDHRIPGGTT